MITPPILLQSNGGPQADPFPRVSTGNAQADEILHGGFPANSINIIMGQPGSGKTIFAEEILFHNVSAERPLMYFSTLSEPMSKVVSYAQRQDFFKVDAIGTQLIYDDLSPDLATGGPAAVIPRMTDAIKTLSPAIIVIDSFKAIHDLSESTQQSRHVVATLAAVLSAYDVTAFLLGEYTHDNIELFPEFAIADSILQLERHVLGTRDERYLRVLKLRGSGYQEGQHAFQITSDGLRIYPRLVTPDFADYIPTLERRRMGVPGLDPMLGGGAWAGSTSLLVGPTGGGKTTMALQFVLEGVRAGVPSLYVNFQENPSQVRRMIAALGADPDEVVRAGFHHIYRSPVELQIDSVIVEIFDLIRTAGIKRIAIDAVGDLAMAANDAQRLHDYLYSLTQHFTVRNATSMLTFESVLGITGISALQERISYMSDNVLVVTAADDVSGERTIRVVKSRNSAHDVHPRPLRIGAGGVEIGPH